MADEAEGFVAVTNAEATVIMDPVATDAGGWGIDLTKDDSNKYLGNPTVLIENGSADPGSGVTVRDLIPVGSSSSFRMWVALYAVNTSAYSIRWGLMRYNSSEALVDAVYVDTTYASVFESWTNLESVLPVGAAAFVRPFVISAAETGLMFNVGLMDAAPVEPAFRAYRSASAQSIAASPSIVKVQFNAEQHDLASNYDHVTNYRFTAPSAGIYAFAATVALGCSTFTAGSRATLMPYVNGSLYTVADNKEEASGGGNTLVLAWSDPALLLAAGDYVEIYVVHDDPGSVTAAVTYTVFSGAKIR